MSVMRTYHLGELADLLGCTLEGDPDVAVSGVSTIEKAGPADITFLANMKYAPRVRASKAAAIIASEPISDTAATLISANPYYDFARALGLFYEAPQPRPGIHSTACIADTAEVGPGAAIGAYVVVGE